MTSSGARCTPFGTPSIERDRSIGSQDGSITAFVTLLSVAIFVLLGLVVDVGRAVAERSALLSEAEQAARSGAGQLSITAMRSGHVLIDPVAAENAADRYLSLQAQTGSAVITGQTVTVTIRTAMSTSILGIVGIDRIKVAATASATNVHGVARED